MAKKKTQESTSPPNLIVSRTEAEEKIRAQIEKGREIRKLPINSQVDLEKAQADQSKWSAYNTELLTRLFDNRSIAEEYGRFFGAIIPMNPSFNWRVNVFSKHIDDNITRLESILERLPLIPESVQSAYPNMETPPGKDIFIVHGHDEAAKESVARLIEKLGLRAIILHEQPNAGRTIVEKFEDYSNVGFAIVLLTPDDLGASSDKRVSKYKPRARQNVILELGYFMGKLGRGRVCALYKEGVEIPSDYQGVLYIQMDDAGAWRMSLAKEIKQAGIEADLNKI